MVIGTLDVILAPSVEGEILRGHDRNAAYMINVCVADAARRRGVGKQLIHGAVQTASSLGALFNVVVQYRAILTLLLQSCLSDRHIHFFLHMCSKLSRLSTCRCKHSVRSSHGS